MSATCDPKCHKDDEDSSDSSEDQLDDSSSTSTRKKRHLPHGAFACALKSSRLQANSSERSFESLYGNTRYGNMKMLFSKTQWFLRVDPSGMVHGTQNDDDIHALIKISSAGLPGHVYLEGMQSKLYVAFDKRGRLYGESQKNVEQTVWLEEVFSNYNTYMSRAFAHLGWFLAIKRSGRPKNGKRTGWGQKATLFLPRNIELYQ